MSELSFFNNIKLMYISPSKFLGRKSDSKWTKALLQLILFYIVYLVIESFLNLVVFFKDNGAVQPIAILSWLFLTLQNIIGKGLVILVVLFSVSGVIHLLLKLSRAKTNYKENVKSVSYSLMIWVIYGFIILVASFIIQLTIPIDQSYLQGILATSDITNITQLYKVYFSQPGALILLILGIIQIVHFFTFLIKSTSYFNKIKTGKSAIISIISILVVIAILMLIWIGFLYTSLSSGSFS